LRDATAVEPDAAFRTKDSRTVVVPQFEAGMLVSDHPLANETITVQAALTGDPDAFAALFHEHHPAIYAYAYRLCLCASDAQDVAQETFIKAARALPGYRPEAPFRHWLYHI
jgi:RNA polymerase sigma-70 factor (ECF subfamily)